VIGQPDFISYSYPGPGQVDAKRLNVPTGVAVDTSGNLYVVDAGDNRVLEYNAPISSGAAAHLVFGQKRQLHHLNLPVNQCEQPV
jgi:DNA-binding beta-propeller fold protein YncE